MSAFLPLVRLRIIEITRKPASLIFSLGFPPALVLVLGLVFAQGRPLEHTPVVIVDDAELGHDFGTTSGTESRELALAIANVKIERTPSLERALGRLNARMARAIILPGHPPRVITGEDAAIFGRGLAARIPGAVLELRPPTRLGYLRYLFPGLLTFVVLQAGFFALALPMIRYRQTRFLKKMATTPLRKSTLVAALITGRVVLVLPQLVLLLAAAHWGLGLEVGLVQSAVALALAGLGLLLFTSVGFALAAVIQSDTAMIDLLNAAMLPLVLMSGTFFPSDVFPPALRWFADRLPSSELVVLLRGVLVDGLADPRPVARGVATLLVWCLAALAASVLALRKSEP